MPGCLSTGATTQREDKIVLVDQKKCVGCKACILACPYEARTIWEENGGYFQNGLTPYEKVGYKKHLFGQSRSVIFALTDWLKETTLLCRNLFGKSSHLWRFR